MKLATLYQHLRARASATGEWRSADLPGGATIWYVGYTWEEPPA